MKTNYDHEDGTHFFMIHDPLVQLQAQASPCLLGGDDVVDS
jgi:hypothetical protein